MGGKSPSCDSCLAELVATANALRAYAARHLAAELLVDYAFGHLETGGLSLVAGHLADCRECRDELELVRRSLAEMPAGAQ